MPKIIENLESKLMEEARKQIEESGYEALTIRSVAKACGVGVGTVYNYFPSKEILIATHLLEDWRNCIASIEQVGTTAKSPKPVLLCMYEQLNAFASRHKAIFLSKTAASSFSGSFSHYHSQLRNQLAQPLCTFCTDDFTAQFIAESLLTWTMAGKPFDEIYNLLAKLF